MILLLEADNFSALAAKTLAPVVKCKLRCEVTKLAERIVVPTDT
jgi:hypothetical protein